MKGMSAVPADKKLYDKVKAEADAKFLAPTSAYKSAWIVAQYKRRGGVYLNQKNDDAPSGLARWFKEKWVDLMRPITDPTSKNKIIGYEPCGRKVATTSGTYPLCRPSKRVTIASPKTVDEVLGATNNMKNVQKVKKEKQKVKHTKRVRF